MKKIISLLIVAILLCSVAVAPTTTLAARTKGVKEEVINEDKWLSLSTNTSGPRYFVDVNGKPVNLFGTARCQFHAYDEEWGLYGEPGIDSLIEHYADFGMNFIRLSIYPFELCGGKKPTEEEINAYLTEHVDPDVQGIIRNGMYVMIDLHLYPQQDEKVTFNSAQEFIQYPRDYYIPILEGLARMYKDEPMVAVYEIWNEPVAADRETVPYNFNEWNTSLRSFFIDAVNAIRKIDTRHVIMVSDYNAGWGMCTNSTWGGYYKLVDPVYRNTAFSVHVAREHMDTNFSSFSSYYKSLTRDNNICIIFGEIETEGNLMSTRGMKNLLGLFESTKNEHHFSGALWRPHGWNNEYHELWAQNGWADRYCNVGPFPKSRYTSEAEGAKSDMVEKVTNAMLFGDNKNGMGISLKAGLAADKYYETTVETNQKIVYKQGTYKLMVRAVGKKGYTGDFVVGYKDVEGVVHQIARFHGRDNGGEAYHQTVSFTADKPIASFVFFGCEKSEKSVIIDRLYIEGKAADDELLSRSNYSIPSNAKKIVKLSGALEEVVDKKPTVNNSSKPSNSSNNDKVDNIGFNSTPAQTGSEKQNDSDGNSKNTNDKTETEDTKDNTTQKEQSTENDKNIKKSSTLTTGNTNEYVYIWLGAGIFGAVVIFVVIYIITVKNINKKEKQNSDAIESDIETE